MKPLPAIIFPLWLVSAQTPSELGWNGRTDVLRPALDLKKINKNLIKVSTSGLGNIFLAAKTMDGSLHPAPRTTAAVIGARSENNGVVLIMTLQFPQSRTCRTDRRRIAAAASEEAADFDT